MDDWLQAVVGIGALLVALPLLVLLVAAPLMGGMYGGGMYGGGMHGGGMGGWLLVGLLPLVFLLVFGYVAYRFLRTAKSQDAALSELREAYARGDLTTEEYEERRERLEDSQE